MKIHTFPYVLAWLCSLSNVRVWECHQAPDETTKMTQVQQPQHKQNILVLDKKMRAIVQRVTCASVSVNEELISSIGKGICVLVGISRNDTDKDIEYMVRKLLNLRIWDDENGKRWHYSVSQKKYEILCVSQFTLYNVLKGNSPDFHHAMQASESKVFFDKFISSLKAAYEPDLIKEGKFGNYMQVQIQNDGPVTIQLESPITK